MGITLNHSENKGWMKKNYDKREKRIEERKIKVKF